MQLWNTCVTVPTWTKRNCFCSDDHWAERWLFMVLVCLNITISWQEWSLRTHLRQYLPLDAIYLISSFWNTCPNFVIKIRWVRQNTHVYRVHHCSFLKYAEMYKKIPVMLWPVSLWNYFSDPMSSLIYFSFHRIADWSAFICRACFCQDWLIL